MSSILRERRKPNQTTSDTGAQKRNRINQKTMSKIIWTKVEKLTNYNEKSRHHCVGMCSVTNRSHFSKKRGFDIQHTGFDCNGEQIYKGRCAGHPFNIGKPVEKVVVDERFKSPVDWMDWADATLEALAAAKILAEERAETLRQYSNLRKKLSSKAPKTHVRRFDKAVAAKAFGTAKALARRYGTYL